MEFFIRFRQDGVFHRQTRFHLGDVAFGNFQFHFHLAQIGDFSNGGRGLVGVDGLAFFHRHRHHRACKRRDDFGIAQFHFGGINQYRGLFDGSLGLF